MGYGIDDIRIEALLPALGRAEDRLARLDERVARSPIGEGFRERNHFYDAAASMWIAGELVHIEDLVLHDASMDVRTPTHELTQAHAILRSRRRLWRETASWGIGAAGMATLRGRTALPEADVADDEDPTDELDDDAIAVRDALQAEYAELDAALASAERLLQGNDDTAARSAQSDPRLLIYDPDWDEDARLSEWRDLMSQVERHPPALAAAILWEAWETAEPLQRQHWLGNVLVGAYLRSRGKVTSHLFGLAAGLKTIPRERRRARTRAERIAACLDAMAAAADADLETLNRLHLARGQIEHRLRGRRSSSSLPAVVDLLFSRPIVSAGMIAEAVKVTPRGALSLIGELGVREMTGRGRYRAWGVL
jgi:hypothetical protein